MCLAWNPQGLSSQDECRLEAKDRCCITLAASAREIELRCEFRDPDGEECTLRARIDRREVASLLAWMKAAMKIEAKGFVYHRVNSTLLIRAEPSRRELPYLLFFRQDGKGPLLHAAEFNELCDKIDRLSRKLSSKETPHGNENRTDGR